MLQTTITNSEQKVNVPLVSVVMPCLNEEATIGRCIEKIMQVFTSQAIDGEIIVCDNGSSDHSVSFAEGLGVTVVHQPLEGYGHAYMCGINASRGKFIVMGDADDTYDFNLIPVLLHKLQNEGSEFVTGSRFLADRGANIKFLHRYVGNPALTWLLNFFFRTDYSDVCCGLRAFSRSTYERIKPVSTGMEYNLELAINAGLANMSVAEVATKLGPRQGVSKLNTVVDGWRSLCLMLIYCPDQIFLYPAIWLLVCGLGLHLALCLNSFTLGETLTALSFTAPIFTVVACQTIALGMLARSYSWSRRFTNDSVVASWLHQTFNFERAMALGALLFIGGAIVAVSFLLHWLVMTKPAVSMAASLLMVGVNLIFSALLSTTLSIPRKPIEPESETEPS